MFTNLEISKIGVFIPVITHLLTLPYACITSVNDHILSISIHLSFLNTIVDKDTYEECLPVSTLKRETQYVFVHLMGDLVDNVVSLNIVLCLSHIELDYDKDINIDYRGGCIV